MTSICCNFSSIFRVINLRFSQKPMLRSKFWKSSCILFRKRKHFRQIFFGKNIWQIITSVQGWPLYISFIQTAQCHYKTITFKKQLCTAWSPTSVIPTGIRTNDCIFTKVYAMTSLLPRHCDILLYFNSFKSLTMRACVAYVCAFQHDAQWWHFHKLLLCTEFQ
jgi:hypothetical protein